MCVDILMQAVRSLYSLGLAGVRTNDNVEFFNKPLVVVYFDLDYVRNPKGSNYWRNRVIKVAKEFEELTFSVSDKTAFTKEVSDLGLEEAAVSAGIYDNKGKYAMETEFRFEQIYIHQVFLFSSLLFYIV